MRIWLTRAMCIFALMAHTAAASAQEGFPPAVVDTDVVVREPIRETVSFLGTVRPIMDSTVASEVEGRVARRLVENGDRVTAGHILVRLDDRRLAKQLAIAVAQKEETAAELDLARRQETRARDLFRSEVLSQRDLDEAITRRQALEGRLDATVARIDAIEDDIARTEIRAPFDGVVTEVHTEVGEWLEVGSSVVRLADLGTLEIRLDVPERYYPYVEARDPAPISFEALPDIHVDGTILAVVPLADPDARTFPVLVRGNNPDGRVGAGMLARVELTLSTDDDVLLVPKDAIVDLAFGQEVVFVVEEGTARAITVRTGRASGVLVEVDGDLREGQVVIVRGNERLRPGQAVRTASEEGGVGAPSDD